MRGSEVLGTEEFSKLTTILFAASVGQVDWDVFLGALSAQAGDICTHIIGFDVEANIAMSLEPFGYDPDFVRQYDEHFIAENAWAPGFMAQPVGIPVDCENMCPSEDLLQTRFYNEWLRPQENIAQGGGALLFKSDARVFALGGNIRQKDADRLKGPWLQLLSQLIPHMQQAFEISRISGGK